MLFARKVLLVFLLSVLCDNADAQPLADSEIRKAIIQESISQYPGPCPCPYSVMRNGRSCGRRSAYSRPGGYSPICYDSDVTADMIRMYRRAR